MTIDIYLPAVFLMMQLYISHHHYIGYLAIVTGRKKKMGSLLEQVQAELPSAEIIKPLATSCFSI